MADGLCYRRMGTTNHRLALWMCKCDCEVVKNVISASLRRGLSASCGCLVVDTNRRLNTLKPGEARNRARIRSYKQSAKKRKLIWGLSDIEARSLFDSQCHYCGQEYARGIDRVDNAVGYFVRNVRSCCRVCNFAKGTLTESEFLFWIERVYKNLFLKPTENRC